MDFGDRHGRRSIADGEGPDHGRFGGAEDAASALHYRVPQSHGGHGGEVTPLDAHIRLANPRTPDTEGDLIFRSGLSYSRGFDAAGQLDQGLAFVSYQRKLSQFLNTQARLAGEPLEEYIRAEGGGFYFALPGVRREGEILGEGLLA